MAEAERGLPRVDGDDVGIDRTVQRREDLFLAEPSERGEKAPVKRRPSTAAARSTARVFSARAASRRPMLSEKVRGTMRAAVFDRVHDPPSPTSAPDVTAAASSSSTRKGTPSARPARPSTSPGTAGASRHEPTISATSWWPSRDSWITFETRLAWRARASSSPVDLPSSLKVARHRTRSEARLSARYSTMLSVSGSAQCRSSNTTRHPRLRPRRGGTAGPPRRAP